MAVDNNSLLRTTVEDIVIGIRNERRDFVREVCTVHEVKAIKGTMPVWLSANTLPRDLGGTAIKTAPKQVDMELSSVNWDLLQYSYSNVVTDQEVTDLEQYLDPISNLVRQIVEHAEVALESDLAALLDDNSFNGEHAATTTWDAAGATPIKDVQDAIFEDVPNADQMILSKKSALEASRHADLKERASNYAGEGAISFEQLRGVFSDATGIPPSNIYIWDTVLNSAGKGLSATMGYVVDEFCWIGRREGLLLFEQEGSPTSTVETNHLIHELAYTRTADPVRADIQLGTHITGL